MPTIKFVVDDIVASAEVGEKLADVCERELVSIPFGCKSGNCGTCMVKITGALGAVDLPSEDERSTLAIYGVDKEHRLACQCIVRGDITIDDP